MLGQRRRQWRNIKPALDQVPGADPDGTLLSPGMMEGSRTLRNWLT